VDGNAEMRVVAREGALLAGGARAILLQVAHPGVAKGVAEHSDFATRPLDRLRATLSYVYAVTFGTPEESAAVAAMVTQAHRAVAGAGYRASDPELQLWVAATLYDTAVLIYERLFGALEPPAAETVYRQYSLLGTALQVPSGLWPADRAAFAAYWDHMVGTLQVSDDARRVARDLLHPEWVPPLLSAAMPLNRFLTAAWLPQPIRAQYGIDWEPGQQRRYEMLMTVGGAVYRRLPVPLREAPKTWYLRDVRRRLSAAGPRAG
jgi:uncharacterized protein (DUF2236 family)